MTHNNDLLILKIPTVIAANFINALAVVAGVALVLMMVHVVVDVALRYGLNIALPGTIEYVSYYYMVLAVFLPFALVERRRENIMVTLFTERLGARWVKGLDALVSIVFALSAIVFTWITFDAAMEKTIVGEMKETAGGYVETWPTRWALPISAVAVTIVIISQLLEQFLSKDDETASDSSDDEGENKQGVEK